MSKRWTIADIERLQASGTVKAPELDRRKPGKPSQVMPETALQRYQALGRKGGREMNKTERCYADLLNWRRKAGEVAEWWFEVMNLRIGDNCFYETDFLVLLATGELEVHETKGYITEDSLVKFKAAQTIFPFRFRMMQFKGGEWNEL